MSKSLFSLRQSDGRVMRFNGTQWAVEGTVQGSIWPRLGEDLAAVWFTYLGELYCAFLADAHIIVAKYNQGDLTPVTTRALTGTVTEAVWGNAVSYGGAICWLEHSHEGAVAYRFTGALQRLPFELPGNDHVGVLDELNLVAASGQLLVVPRGIMPSQSAIGARTRSKLLRLDITTDGVEIETTELFAGNSLVAHVPTGEQPFEQLKKMVVAAGSFDDRLYAIFGDGCFGRLDPLTGTRTVITDLRAQACMSLGAVTTTAQGTLAGQIAVKAQALNTLTPLLVGASVTILNDGQFTGAEGTVVGMQPGNPTLLQIAAHADEAFPVMGKFVEVGLHRGFAGGMTNDAQFEATCAALHLTSFVEFGGVLYAFVFGREPKAGNAVSAAAVPSFVIRFDGSSVNVTELKLNGKRPNVFGLSTYVDATTSLVHVLYHDAHVNKARHATYNLSSGVFTEVADAYDIAIPCHCLTLASGNLIGYEAGELGVAIIDTSYDAVNGTMRLDFEVFGDQSAIVDFEYSTGDGWQSATCATAGDGFFVHALVEDLDDYQGPIQYRASVRPA